MSWLLALLLTASAYAQDSNDPFGGQTPTAPSADTDTDTDTDTDADTGTGTIADTDTDADTAPDLPPYTPWAEALVKQGSQACVSTGVLEPGWNALSATVRRPTCAVTVRMTVLEGGEVHYDVIASVTGRDARVVGSWTLKARRGQRAVLEQKGGRQDWLRIEIRPER